MDTGRRPPNCRKPALERLARHSLFGRYMKAQLRLAGDRRKLGRNGLSSDRPRECVDPPENLRDLRDLVVVVEGGGWWRVVDRKFGLVAVGEPRIDAI